MSDIHFLDKLRAFNRDDVPNSIVSALDLFIKESPELALDVVAVSSSAALSLAKWVHAILKYAKVAKIIEPKKEKVREMDELLKKA
jgi:dynein heavy chain